jgi:hypothetical protein
MKGKYLEFTTYSAEKETVPESFVDIKRPYEKMHIQQVQQMQTIMSISF